MHANRCNMWLERVSRVDLAIRTFEMELQYDTGVYIEIDSLQQDVDEMKKIIDKMKETVRAARTR